MKSFRLKIKAKTIDGLLKDTEVEAKIFILSEKAPENLNYIFITSPIPLDILGNSLNGSVGYGFCKCSYPGNKHVEFLDYLKLDREKFDERLKNETIKAHVENGQILEGSEEILGQAGIYLIKDNH